MHTYNYMCLTDAGRTQGGLSGEEGGSLLMARRGSREPP